MTEMQKIWLKALYLEEAEDHYAMAEHEHLCALGSPDNEIATMHELSADEHREFANMLKAMAKNINEEE